MSSFGVRRGKG